MSKNSELNYKGKKRYISALLSGVYMGLGQIYNKQYIKGISFILFWSLILVSSLGFLIENIVPIAVYDDKAGFFTIGSTPGAGNDHSLFILVHALVAISLLLILLALYVLNIYDAYKKGARLDLGMEVADFKETVKRFINRIKTLSFLIPCLFFLFIAVIFPIIFNFLIAFTDYSLYNSPPANLLNWVGFENFTDLLSVAQLRGTFLTVLGWTVIWTFFATITPYIVGILYAAILNDKDIKYKGIIRTVFLLPLSIPFFASIGVWRSLLGGNIHVIGSINYIFDLIGLDAIALLQDPFWARVSLVMVNLWLTFPFCMVIVLGILQSIDRNLFNAAAIDGANRWQKFKNIVLPLVSRQLAPIFIIHAAFNFNNFNVIYLFNQGYPSSLELYLGAGYTDTLMSWGYKMARQMRQYSDSAAISVLIFIILAFTSILLFTGTDAFKEEGVN